MKQLNLPDSLNISFIRKMEANLLSFFRSNLVRVYILLLCIFNLYPQQSTAQDVRNSRQSGYYTYIYRITNTQSETIFKKGAWCINDSYFTDLVDSFETNKVKKDSLPTGHYLMVYVEKNQLKVEAFSNNNVNISILNNDQDLSIMVNNNEGKIVEDAQVFIKTHAISYNPQTHTYFLSRTKRHGVLKVVYLENANFFELKAQTKLNGFKYGYKKAVGCKPAKIIVIPASLIYYFPKNTFTLFKEHHYASGVYYYLWKPFGDIIKTAKYGYPYGYIKSFGEIFQSRDNDFEGFMVFNKPKFRPGDTLFLKAWVTDKKLKPIHDSLKIYIVTNDNTIAAWVKPYRPGGYQYRFVLNNLPGLKLDRDYMVFIEGKNHKRLYNSFRYEDYELKSTSYELRTSKPVYHFGEKVVAFCKGTDENGLTLPDARAVLVLVTKGVNEYYTNRIYVPDTLWKTKLPLDALGETKITIPDSVFPEVSLIAELRASFLNSANELQTRMISFTKDNHRKEITFTLSNDSALINLNVNAIPVVAYANLSVPGFMDNQKITLPYKFKINPFASRYTIIADSTARSIDLSNENDEIECYPVRTADSVFFTLSNPRNLPINYTIFRKNKPIFRSSVTENFKCKAALKTGYFVSIQYVWGGEVKTLNYEFTIQNKALNIRLFQPQVVFPGQKTTLKLKVTDFKGNPVSHADITALSMTKKFNNYNIPDLPDYSRKYPRRDFINRFSETNNKNSTKASRNLNYKKWNPIFGLDSVEYYKFLYPSCGIYQNVFARNDTSFAEIAPFLVDSMGNLMPINILYIDNEPVYYSITTNSKPYSFKVTEGWHSITMRTTRKEVLLKYIHVKNGTKTVVSINPFITNDNIAVTGKPVTYTFAEANLIRSSIICLRYNNYNSLSYISQYDNFELPGNFSKYNYPIIAGPFKPLPLNYTQSDFFNTNVTFEPGFEYEFLPGLLKMRSWSILNNGNFNYTDNESPSENFNDSVYTIRDILKFAEDERNNRLRITPVYNNPETTDRGRAELLLDYRNTKSNDKNIRNFLVFAYDIPGFTRVYRGADNRVRDLLPGRYRILSLLYDNSYIETDSVYVKPYGINYCRYDDKSSKTANVFTDSITKIIYHRIFPDYRIAEKNYEQQKEQERLDLLAAKSRTISYNSGHYLTGRITDLATKETLPGVSIKINRIYGAISDINGYFNVEIPSATYNVEFTFLGYKKQELNLKQGGNIEVGLITDIQRLEEVVVVGYGVQKSRCLTASVQKVEITEMLQGKVSGVDVLASPTIRVRGVSSIQNQPNMLYIVDGIPQTGSFNLSNPEKFENIEILKNAEATTLYGSAGANGVVIITTRKTGNNSIMKEMLKNSAYMAGIAQSKSLRNRFSDYAFWQPNLTTDNNGVASFEVTFPDDITSWKTFYLAEGYKGACGQAEGEIKSFKPIASSLALPRFLLYGDQCNLIGKALNYTEDSIKVKTAFFINDSAAKNSSAKILSSRIDTFTLNTPVGDSVKIKYLLSMDDGYTDGEERYVPLFPLGTEETKGAFFNLDKDTSLTIHFDKNIKNVTLHAEADLINVILDDLKRMRNYEHCCNEQLSSKLKGLLLERTVYNALGKKYLLDNDIKKIIKLLDERKNVDSLWGWWAKGNTCIWISLHVVEALKKAEMAGFMHTSDLKLVLPYLYRNFASFNYRDKIRNVKLLKLIDTVPDYRKLVDSIKIDKYDSVGRYELWELRQLCGLKFPLDTLKREHKTTLFGNYYWGTDCFSLFNDAISASLVAYRILRNAEPANPDLRKIRNYFLERRGNLEWRNTWETSRILETILPDIIREKEYNLKPRLIVKGDFSDTINKFPYTRKLNNINSITVEKITKAPVYFTAYQQFFNPNPEKVSKDFIVSSRFIETDSVLKAGKPIKLQVKIDVKKASEYVMIEIPIPAGCSYQSKNNFVYGEDYREYFKNKVCIYCSRLGQREYTFEVDLLPRFNGTYHLNPAKAELMYFPVFYGREGMKKVSIE